MKKISYIFGTFHTKDPILSKLSIQVKSKLKKSQRLYTEIPMTKKSAHEIFLFSKIKHPSTLKQRLQPKTIKLLLTYLKTHKLSYTLKTLKIYKTWAIALMLSNKKGSTLHEDKLFMDEKIVAYAKKKHIQQSALETPKEQLSYFDTLSHKEQEQFLLDALTKSENTAYTQALQNWYQKGEPKGFLDLQKAYRSDNKKQRQLDKLLNEGLLIKRNSRFSKRIDILLKHNANLCYFFAIGAGHLSGEKGILHKLKHLGYTIKKID